MLTRAAIVLVVLGAGAAGLYYVMRAEPSWYARFRYPLHYETIVTTHARNYELEPALLAAVIYQESRFRADAVSPVGAVGLMQLLPNTAQGIAIRTGGTRFRVEDLYDPDINVRYGCWYLRHLLRKYGDEKTALAAYNAGQDNVDRWIRERKGIAYAETRHYVKRVGELKKIYRRSYESLNPSRQTTFAAAARADPTSP